MNRFLVGRQTCSVSIRTHGIERKRNVRQQMLRNRIRLGSDTREMVRRNETKGARERQLKGHSGGGWVVDDSAR